MARRPFQARLTIWAATSSLLMVRFSSHHCEGMATIPTSIWAYSGAVRGSMPWSENCEASSPETWMATSASSVEYVPEARSLPLERMRKPSGES